MKPRPLSNPMGVFLATATPLLLLSGGAPLAQQPGADVDCMVGTAAYPTIQSAVDAPACATIRVPAGTFRENVTIGRSLTVRGAGPERTTIDASGKNSPVFAISSPPDRKPCDPPAFIVTLAGMTMTGGTGPGETFPNRNGGAISASPGVKLTVENTIVTGNSAFMNGGGISLVMGRLTVVDSVITRNTAFANPPPGPANPNYIGGGGGLRVAGCPSVLIVKNSVVKDNVSHRHGGGILGNVPTPLVLSPGLSIPGPDGTLVLVGSEIMRNTATEANGGGGIYSFRMDLSALDSQIKHNYPDDLKQDPNP